MEGGRTSMLQSADFARPSFVMEQGGISWRSLGTPHYGTKLAHFETSKIHFPSGGVSEVSERASEQVSAAEGASKASSPEQANE